MVMNMSTAAVIILYCCFTGTMTALSEIAVSDPDDRIESLNTSSGAQFQKRLRRFLPLGSSYCRVGLHFSKGLPWASRESQPRTSPRQDEPAVNCKKKIEFQIFEVSTKAAVAGDNTSDTGDDGGHGARKLEIIIGMSVAIGIFLGAILVVWLWYKFWYRPRRQAPTLPVDRRLASAEEEATNNSVSSVSKIQLLGSWLTNSFSAVHTRTRRRRQVVWLSSACEMQYSKLQAATNNFTANNLLGEGGTSRVYRAKLENDTLAAVKRLDTLRNRRLTESQFESEVELMRQVRHPNLVSLLGFCKQGDHRLLVYELMQNGSLEDQLYGPSKGSALTWNLRIKIALESARGLEYLHEHCVPPVVHRDLKASNILLDCNFNAKISDFGLATPLEGLTREESLQLIGTVGYVAPEFFETGALTEKSDVYAFGVVLLELLTGRKPIDHSLPQEEHSLVNWTKPQLTDRRRLPHIVAPTIKSHLNLKHLYQVAAVAALCVCEEPSYRPLIADVVQSLVPLVPIELGGALRSSQAHSPRSPSPASTAELNHKRSKSGSRSFSAGRSFSQEKNT